MVRATMDKMEMAIKLQEAPSCAPAILAAFKKRLPSMLDDFFLAARVVNPEYDTTGTEQDPSLMPAFIKVIRRMLHEDEDAAKKVNKILSDELPAFDERVGVLISDPDVQRCMKTMMPHMWWKKFGRSDFPNLQPLAVRLLAQVVGEGDAERNWRDWDFLVDKKRARMDPETGNKLMHVYCGFKMEDKAQASDYQLQVREWREINDKLQITGDSYISTAKREFRAYIEDWESEAVTSREDNLDAQRRLVKKYKGVFIFDREPGAPDYHGEVVGVEYQKGKRQRGATTPGQWVVSVVQAIQRANGRWGAVDDKEAEVVTYYINSTLTALVSSSPLNTFLRLVGRAAEGESQAGEEEHKNSGEPVGEAAGEVLDVED